MKKSLVKDFFREIWKTKSRFLSIMAIVALGSGFYAGINVTTTDMKLTAENYYNNYNLMDFQLISTLGITDDDVAALEAQKDALKIDTIMPTYTKDVIINAGREDQVAVKVMSYSENQSLNQYKLLDGRMPEKPNECVVDRSHKVPENFKIGETIKLSAGMDGEDLLDSLAGDTYEIVGIVQTPMYIDFSRGYTNIGSGTLNSFIVVPEEAFAMDVYTNIFLTTQGKLGMDPYGEAYRSLIDERTPALKTFMEERTEMRSDDVLIDAKKQLEDGKKELADGEKTAQKELDKAKKQLDDAKKQITDGKKELEKQKKTLESEKASGEQQLKDAEQKILDGEAELAAQEAKLNAGIKEYEAAYPDAIAQIEAGEKQLAAEKKKAQQQFADAENQLADAKQQLDAAKQQIDLGQTALDLNKMQLTASQSSLDWQKSQLESSKSWMSPALYESSLTRLEQQQAQLDKKWKDYEASQADLNTGIAQYEAGLAEYNTGYQEYLNGKAQAESQFSAAQAELDSARKQLTDAKAQLDAGKIAIAQGKAELASGKQELSKEKQNFKKLIADANEQLLDAEVKLIDAEKELADGQEEYNKAKKETEQELTDARNKLAYAERQIENLENPEYYVWTRADNVGYSNFEDDADIIKNVSTVLPVFFILIAVLICLTTMTRMVEERRTQIGTLKALGYGKGSIMAKYVLYAIFATVIGCTIGLVVGFTALPAILFAAYGNAYNIPDHQIPFHWGMGGFVTGIAILCMTGATLIACYKELLAEPATLMRPKAPPAGKKILLERWKGLWKRFPFAMKLTIRNIFRYKKRAIMTIVGIAGCTALMLTGFGMDYAITSVSSTQFDSITLYDGIVQMADGLKQTEKETVFQEVSEINGVSSQMYALLSNEDYVRSDSERVSVILLVPEDTEEFTANYFDLRTRGDRTPVPMTDDGVVINEKLARMCGLSIGDQFQVEHEGKTVDVTLAATVENYVGNYVFMTPALYEDVFEEAPDYANILIKISDSDQQTQIATELTRNKNIMGSTFNDANKKSFDDITANMSSIVLVIIVAAGLLAFIVLYNLVNINVAERTRELATLKVLGYRDHETSAYIYRENIICSVIGILLGLFGGIFLEGFVIRTAEVESAMFSPDIPWYCFLFAGVLTFVFTLVVNVALHFKLKKLNMVESLKSIE